MRHYSILSHVFQSARLSYFALVVFTIIGCCPQNKPTSVQVKFNEFEPFWIGDTRVELYIPQRGRDARIGISAPKTGEMKIDGRILHFSKQGGATWSREVEERIRIDDALLSIVAINREERTITARIDAHKSSKIVLPAGKGDWPPKK